MRARRALSEHDKRLRFRSESPSERDCRSTRQALQSSLLRVGDLGARRCRPARLMAAEAPGLPSRVLGFRLAGAFLLFFCDLGRTGDSCHLFASGGVGAASRPSSRGRVSSPRRTTRAGRTLRSGSLLSFSSFPIAIFSPAFASPLAEDETAADERVVDLVEARCPLSPSRAASGTPDCNARRAEAGKLIGADGRADGPSGSLDIPIGRVNAGHWRQHVREPLLLGHGSRARQPPRSLRRAPPCICGPAISPSLPSAAVRARVSPSMPRRRTVPRDSYLHGVGTASRASNQCRGCCRRMSPAILRPK